MRACRGHAAEEATEKSPIYSKPGRSTKNVKANLRFSLLFRFYRPRPQREELKGEFALFVFIRCPLFRCNFFSGLLSLNFAKLVSSILISFYILYFMCAPLKIIAYHFDTYIYIFFFFLYFVVAFVIFNALPWNSCLLVQNIRSFREEFFGLLKILIRFAG